MSLDDAIYSALFGQYGNDLLHRAKNDLEHSLKVTLDELYTGTVKHVDLKRTAICSVCSGSGSRNGYRKQCHGCMGRGMKIVTVPVCGMLGQKLRRECEMCRGTGIFVNQRDRCKDCQGKRTKIETEKVEIRVQRGMRHKENIVLCGAGNQEVGMQRGNLKVILLQEEHDVFARNGDDLFMKHPISLTEALCGFSLVVKHLDGRILHIRPPPGTIVQPEMVMELEGEGMPNRKNPRRRGTLFIKFEMEFPKNHFADKASLLTIKELLPSKVVPDTIPDLTLEHVEEVELQEYTHQSTRRPQQEVFHETDDDDDDGGPESVSCSQQ